LITKVPEGQPKVKVFQLLFGGAVRQSPPGLDGEVPHFRLKHRGCVAILEAKTLVLVLQVMLNIELGVFLQRLGPMEVVGSFTSIDGNLRISKPVDNPHDIPIGFCTVSHESFEVRLGNSMPNHDVVEVVPEKHLSNLILRLEVVANDGHDALVGSVVYVAGHGGPLGDAFEMVGHDPSMLEISAKLHVFNQVDPTTMVVLKHLENKNFVCIVTLAWELILLDIGPGANTSNLGDAIHNS
jgi:hypothetical protein